MQSAKFVFILALAGAIAAGAIGIQGLHAGQKTKDTVLLKVALVGVEGKEVIVKHFEFPPGWVGSKHYHTGHGFVYVLESSFVVDMEGKAPFAVRPGEVFQELPGKVFRGSNSSATEWLKIILFQVGDEGKPITVQVK